ncbi:UNVERIFIED_CONTAM: 26S proteasome regulatory subunit 7A [Sesamum indicum]
MSAKVVVFPIRGRNWCFSRSIDPSVLAPQSSNTPSTLKDLCSKIFSSSQHSKTSSEDSKVELAVDFVANKVDWAQDLLPELLGPNLGGYTSSLEKKKKANPLYRLRMINVELSWSLSMNGAWSNLEKAPQGTFKNKIHGLGLKLLSRVRPSEIFFRSIPKEIDRVDIVYPSSLNPRLVRRRLRHIAFRGSIIHKKYFYGSAVLLPLTSVFMFLPLPNIPFFWILFRTYSHWRASQGSEKLLHLVSDASSRPEQSIEMAKDGKVSSPNSDKGSDHSTTSPLVFQPSEELQKLLHYKDGEDGLSEANNKFALKLTQGGDLAVEEQLAISLGKFHFCSLLFRVLLLQEKFQKRKRGKSISTKMAPEPEDEIKDEKNPRPLDEDDIALLKTYVILLFTFTVNPSCELFSLGLGPYSTSIKKVEKEIKEMAKKINDLCGIKESDTGLAAPSQWDLVSDKQMMQEEQPLQVARCTKIINPNTEDAKYVINVKQIAKFVVGLGDKVSPTDIEEGMRVGVDRNKYQIQIPLPPKIDPSVTMMTVEEKPDVTYNDVGGCKEQIEKMREVVELPMLHPEKFVKLGIDPPKGVLCYGPPGTGKTLLARAVANRTDACFIRVIGSELVQKYVGEGARMVRELFQMARSKKACIVFFDEVDAIGGARFDDGVGGDNEVQRTMLEIVNQLDGFDARGNIKVLMATNRPDTLDPALLRPGRLDRKVEFGLPDLESRTQIFKIHTRTMNCERDIRFELLARLCPNSTGADIRSVCTEAGMYAIRARRKTVTEKDFLDAVNKYGVVWEPRVTGPSIGILSDNYTRRRSSLLAWLLTENCTQWLSLAVVTFISFGSSQQC